MSENKQKNRKMNLFGYICIAVTFGIMVYSHFANTEGPVLSRLFTGVCAYGLCFFGAGIITLIIYLGMYFANMFFNTIYDEDKEPPAWDNADHMILVFFVALYVSDLAGWMKIV